MHKRFIVGIIKKTNSLVKHFLLRLINFFVWILPYKYGLYSGGSREKRLIVSLTSYPKRFERIHLTIKTILYQTLKPDKIILYLSEDECKKPLPENILKLQKYGLEIVFVRENLKPHNKYYYSMCHYPRDIIITIDDDILYPFNMLKCLYKSYQKWPNCISSSRVHRIRILEDGKIARYNDWDYEYKSEIKPSQWLIATGVSGVLYPPALLPENTFKTEDIKEFCLNADDIWLKFMEVMAGIKVVYVPKANPHLIQNGNISKEGLYLSNVILDKNDEYLESICRHFKVDFLQCIILNEESKNEKKNKS